MKPPVLPTHLVPGDTVLLTSVSSPVPSDAHLHRMIACLRALGLQVRPAEHVMAREAYAAGPPEVRATDFNRGLADGNVRAIFFAWGGKAANQILPLLDYDQFARQPKIVVGLSDPVTILNALYARTGVLTFHGPTGVNFSDPAGLAPYTTNALRRVLFSSAPPGALPAFSPWETLRAGRAQGRILGGHLSTMQTLLGTPFEPAWDESIFFWEEVGRTPRQIDHILTHFKLRGVFEKIRGMVVGRLLGCEDKEADMNVDPRKMILSLCKEYSFPILFNVDSGHADPKLTIPIGGIAELDLGDGRMSFALPEACVC
jgi:muramoyltetrapeptide carboxypeptidase